MYHYNFLQSHPYNFSCVFLFVKISSTVTISTLINA